MMAGDLIIVITSGKEISAALVWKLLPTADVLLCIPSVVVECTASGDCVSSAKLA